MECNENRKRALIIFLLLLALLIPSVAFSSGYGGFMLGSKSRGMGNAFVGLADDPSAISINPAGIVQLDKTQVLMGFTLVENHGKFVSSGNAGINKKGEESSLETQLGIVPNLYITHKVNDRVSIGFGEYTIYGGSFIWEDKFEGRYAPSGKEGTIQTMTFSPVAAFKLTDGLSVGVGGRVQYLKTVFDNVNYIIPVLHQPEVKITAKDWALGWNIALLWKITDNFSTGIHYRSEINHETEEDDVVFTPQIKWLQVRKTDASFDFNFPQNATFGIAWSQGPATLTLDATWWDWSRSNREIIIKFKDKVGFRSSQTEPWNWKDAWSVGIGGEYRLNALNRVIALRAGYMWDQCPIPDHTLQPSGIHGNNHAFSIGTGLPIGPLHVDTFFEYILTEDREWNNSVGDKRHPGRILRGQHRITGEFEDYNTYTFGIDLTYKF